MRTTRVVLALLLSAAASLPAAPARANCGAEGCPLAPRGPEAAFGRFSFNVGYQVIEQSRYWNGTHSISADEALLAESDESHILEQLTRTRVTLMDADVQVTRRLGLAFTLPYVDRIHRHAFEHHAGYFIPSEWHMKGLGDGTAIASWRLLDGSRPALGALTVLAGAKLPTGRTSVAEVDGEAPEASARPGSGSTDAVAGLQYRRAVRVPGLAGSAVPVTASVNARFNGKGTDEYRMGNEWNASVGASVPVARTVHLLAQLNASKHARDDAGNTDAEPHHTGSSSLFASPGLLVQVVPGMSAFGYYQARLYEHTNGPQLVSPYHLSFGLAYALK